MLVRKILVRITQHAKLGLLSVGDYQCLCVDGSGFKGHNCDEGKESYTFISIANHMISSEIWDKSARVYFERPIKLHEPVRS